MANMMEMTRERMNEIFNQSEPHNVYGTVPTALSDRWLCRAVQVIYQAVCTDELSRTDPNERYALQYLSGIVTTSNTLKNHKDRVEQLRQEIAKPDTNDLLWAKIREYSVRYAAENGTAPTV